MPVTLKDIAKQAMALTPEDRAQLANLLVESLDSGTLSKIDRAWIDECQRRLDEYRSGNLVPIPAEQAMNKVRDALER